MSDRSTSTTPDIFEKVVWVLTSKQNFGGYQIQKNVACWENTPNAKYNGELFDNNFCDLACPVKLFFMMNWKI